MRKTHGSLVPDRPTDHPDRPPMQRPNAEDDDLNQSSAVWSATMRAVCYGKPLYRDKRAA